MGTRDDVERILASKPDGMTQAEAVKALKEEGIKVRSDIIRKRLNELSRYNPPGLGEMRPAYGIQVKR